MSRWKVCAHHKAGKDATKLLASSVRSHPRSPQSRVPPWRPDNIILAGKAIRIVDLGRAQLHAADDERMRQERRAEMS